MIQQGPWDWPTWQGWVSRSRACSGRTGQVGGSGQGIRGAAKMQQWQLVKAMAVVPEGPRKERSLPPHLCFQQVPGSSVKKWTQVQVPHHCCRGTAIITHTAGVQTQEGLAVSRTALRQATSSAGAVPSPHLVNGPPSCRADQESPPPQLAKADFPEAESMEPILQTPPDRVQSMPSHAPPHLPGPGRKNQPAAG